MDCYSLLSTHVHENKSLRLFLWFLIRLTHRVSDLTKPLYYSVIIIMTIKLWCAKYTINATNLNDSSIMWLLKKRCAVTLRKRTKKGI